MISTVAPSMPALRSASDRQVTASALYLAEHLAEVPAIVIPTIIGRHDGSGRPGLFDSVIQAAWSFCLALRARGLGTAWVTGRPARTEARVKEILGIPDQMTEIAVFPVAYTIGTDFRRAPRLPARAITFFDHFGATFEHGPADSIRFEDGPGAVAEIDIDAPIDRIWRLVTDLNLPARFSDEFLGAEWAGDERGIGAMFQGRNRHDAVGEWSVPCFVDAFDEHRRFGWCTSDRQNPGARWRFDLEPNGGGTRLRFSYHMGPGPSGTTMAIAAHPGKESRRPAPPARRGIRQHAAHGVRHQKNRRRACRDPPRRRHQRAVAARPAWSSSARQSSSESTRCGCRSSGPATPSLRWPTWPRAPRPSGWPPASPSSAPVPRPCWPCRAQSLQALSGGRFVLGIGTSGPQVMEGWHGVRFDRPVQRTRETIEIIRTITAGDRLEHHGPVYELPLPGGEGRAIRSLMPPAHVPIYVASLGPANLRLTGELADGWIGTRSFPSRPTCFSTPIREGAARAGRDPAELDLTVAVGVEFTDDVDAAGRRHAAGYAFTFGAMGSPATTSTTTPSPARATATTSERCSSSGRPATPRPPAGGSPPRFGLGTNLVGTDDLILDRLRALPRRRDHHAAAPASMAPISTANSAIYIACSNSWAPSTTRRRRTG